MLDKELEEYNKALDEIEGAVRNVRLAPCSTSLESIGSAKSGLHGIRALANRAQGALTRLHHAYTLHLEVVRDRKPTQTERNQ